MTALAAACACAAVLVLLPGRPRLASAPVPRARPDLVRPLLVLSAGCGGWLFVGGGSGVVAGVVTAAAAGFVLARAEPPAVRREREAAERDLPHLVDLFAATLQSGADPITGLAAVCAALPGPAANRLTPVLARARLGGSAPWEAVADDPVVGAVGRALARSQSSGASVVDVVDRLADELERHSLARAEDRARRVGVLAAVPLGLCLLPAFLLLGIVPTVAALLAELTG